MFRVLDSFRVFVCNFVILVFGLIITNIFRVQTGGSNSEEKESGYFVGSEFGALKEQKESNDHHVDEGNGEGENCGLVASTNKYDFFCRKHISGFMEESKTESFIVCELYMGSDDFNFCNVQTPGFLSKGDVKSIAEAPVENLNVEQKVKQDSIMKANTDDATQEGDECFKSFIVEKISETEELEAEVKDSVEEKTESFADSFIVKDTSERQEQEVEEGNDNDVEEGNDNDVLEEKAVVEKISETEELKAEVKDSDEAKTETFADSFIVSDTSERQEQEVEEANDNDVFKEKTEESSEISACAKSSETGEEEIPDTLEEKTEEKAEEIEANSVDEEKTEEILGSYVIGKNSELGETTQQDIHPCNMESDHKPEDSTHKDTEREGEESGSISDSDEEDDGSLAHDDIIDRLRMELKMARRGGLPTILEESEFPKMDEQLKPLKIDEKFDHKDRIAEIQKFYEIYLNKMRKLDILNSQTSHAISLLQLKDPNRATSSGKSSASSSIKSLLSQSIRWFKQQKPETDRALTSIRDLQRDLETVYIGQLCLSWEILQWQRGKAQELLEIERDSQGIRQYQYNQVAGEFQLFQVVLQRFLENEPFQGRPRVFNYVKSRSVFPNFLQVPVVKDDFSKDKKGTGRDNQEEDVISITRITEIIEESMHVFLAFLRSDKDEALVSSKTAQQWQVAPEDPLDLELLMGVRSDFQKKERRLKEMLRRSNCLVRKFNKHNNGSGDPMDGAIFMAQVELKLVWRVLNMRKLSVDQLVWCSKKLGKINFCSRKIKIEPSILFFPC